MSAQPERNGNRHANSSIGSWRPMASAPRDGTLILGWFPGAETADEIMLIQMLEFEGDPDGPQWWQHGNDTAVDVEPALWHPLPDPPTERRT